MLTIRPATLKDLGAITEIYNQAILKTVATFDTEPKTLKQQKVWFANHGAKYPIMVAEDDAIIGWASLSRWSDRCAYDSTAEFSIYIKEGFQNQGIGRKLAEETMLAGKDAGLHCLLARIVSGNKASIHLCEQIGFTHIGVMKEVGYKFKRLLDVYLLQKIYT